MAIGELDPYGAIDSSDGGRTSRYSLSAALRKSVSGFRLPDATPSNSGTGLHRGPIVPNPEVATTGTFRRVSGDLNG